MDGITREDIKKADNTRQLLEQLLIQANEHLRETDRKKDQMFSLFIALLGFYFSISAKFISQSSILAIVLSLFMIVTGIIMDIAVAGYQMWHAVYVNTIIVLEKLLYKGYNEINENVLQEIYTSHISNSKFHSGGKGVEIKLYFLLVLTTSFLWTLLAYEIYQYAHLTNDCILLCTLSIATVIIIILHILGLLKYRAMLLEDAKNNFLEKSWILKFIDLTKTSTTS